MLRFPIPRPRKGNGTLLPAALVGALAVVVVVQLASVSSSETDIEPLTVRIRTAGPAVPQISMIVADKVIEDRPIFAPTRMNSAGEGAGDPLAGMQVSGAWSVGGRSNLVLRNPDGTSRTIRTGQSVNGWTLGAITHDGARFWRDGKNILVPFGSSAPAPPNTETTEEQE